MAMGLNHLFGFDSCLYLQIIDILGQYSLKHPFVLNFFDELMSKSWLKLSRKVFLCQSGECLGFFLEVVDMKNCFWHREIEIFEFAVETRVG